MNYRFRISKRCASARQKCPMANASWIVIRPSRLVCLPLGPQPQSLEGFSTGSTMVNISLANDHRISLIGYHRDGHCILHGAWLQRPVMSPVYIPPSPSIRWSHILLVMWRPNRGAVLFPCGSVGDRGYTDHPECFSH